MPVTSMRAFHLLMCLSFRGRCGMRRLIPSDRLAMPAPQFAIAAGPASFRSTRNGELARCYPGPAPRIQHARGIQSPPADLLTNRKPEYDGTFAKLGELKGWRTACPPKKRRVGFTLVTTYDPRATAFGVATNATCVLCDQSRHVPAIDVDISMLALSRNTCPRNIVCNICTTKHVSGRRARVMVFQPSEHVFLFDPSPANEA